MVSIIYCMRMHLTACDLTESWCQQENVTSVQSAQTALLTALNVAYLCVHMAHLIHHVAGC